MKLSLAMKISEIADYLDNKGMYVEADIVTNVLRSAAKKSDVEDMTNKILNLFDESDVKCPDCGGKMDMEDGLCNCGDEDCDCTIDMKDEIEDFLHRLNIGNIDCPECRGTMEMRGMQCVCTNGKCKCKQDIKKSLLNNIFENKEDEVDFSDKRTASRNDHEFAMARKQLAAAHDAIERIMDKLGTDEGDMMAWVQAYITMASDYLQSVANNAEFGDDFDLSDNDEDYGSVEELGPDDYMSDDMDKFASTEKKTKKPLNKPFRTPGGPKKFSVYVKNEKGNVVKVNFGDPNMEIKRDDPNRRKNFRARHRCETPGPKTKARYWACRTWESGKSVTDITKGK